jgi:C1A family cysteine protease
MPKQAILTILTALLLSTIVYHLIGQHQDSSLYSGNVLATFSSWKLRHNRSYPTPEEHAYRLKVFAETYQRVKAHNNNPKSTSTFALNKFSDMTIRELRIKKTGLFTPLEDPNRPKKTHNPNQVNPKEVDWRKKQAVPPIEDQKNCGGCYAFSANDALSTAWFVAKNELIWFSAQQILDCSNDYGNHGCSGGLMTYAWDYTKAEGITDTTHYPYAGIDKPCQTGKPVKARTTGYVELEKYNCKALEDATAMTAVTVAMDADAIFTYSSGIFSGSCGTNLYHSLTTVGYGTSADGVDFWILKNMWGTDWGEDGYIRMLKNTSTSDKGICGICSMMSYPQV